MLVLKNGKPASFDGHYVAHVDEATAKAGTYYDVEGHTTVSWYLETEPDYYTIQDCAGDLFELTEIMVTDELSKNGGITFAWDENCVTVSSSDAFEAWTLIESLQSR